MKLPRIPLLTPLLLGLLFLITAGSTLVPPRLSRPEKDFEKFWQTYKDHYAFFALHHVDWEQTYATFRPTITARTTPAELQATLARMVEPLRDGHITIARGDKILYKGTSQRHSYKTDFREVQETYWQTAYQNLQAAGFEPVRGLGSQVGKFQVLYLSKSSGNVGYLRLSRCFAELSGVMGSTRQEQQDQQRLLGLFDAALRELSACRALIVDLRGNGGGHSGKEMASRLSVGRHLTHFTAERRPGGYEQFTPLAPYYLTPNPGLNYQQPVVLLTNDGTASSAEEFVLALYRQPHVTTIGDNTAGMLSDMYPAQLSGKVTFTLSHQRYYSPDSVLLEGRGVPVRLPVAYPRQALDQRHDPVLARALAVIR
ncbi:S41 family peptidase [Hymenobacter sp. BT635]|uniref:S41 family peptidase n=1 Tax=Hymenobacter nitidus TaxID=2880929 RepID=A0ABS8AGR2_9BACT|nr:S41 family peptidase [Hymenobacter nitidus]MCB2379274.1 S41 family peptidase [Hymenobacter nitidus]